MEVQEGKITGNTNGGLYGLTTALQGETVGHIKIAFRGMALVYGECEFCKQTFSFDNDRWFNFCPYCGVRLEEE